MTQEADKEHRAGEQPSTGSARPALVEGLDYYIEGGLMVFTAYYLSRRGYCCANGCRHCPYPEDAKE
jgi:hypothetical protein